MSEVITKAYLLNRLDYDTFDEIISFINEHGNIFSVLALGVKKILSKNSRNLFYGCLSEFEFFSSRDINNKLGKLKKVSIIENNIHLSYRKPLLLLNQIIYIAKIVGKNSFNLINKIVELLKEYNSDYDDEICLLILIESTKLLGININLKKCSICGSKKIYSLSKDDRGFVCKDHFSEKYIEKRDSNFIKYVYLVSEWNFDNILCFSKNIKKSSLRFFVDYINDYCGIDLYRYLFSSNKIA